MKFQLLFLIVLLSTSALALKENMLDTSSVSGVITSTDYDKNITFDGDDYVTYAHSSDLVPDKFTLVLWMYPNAYTDTRIINKGAYSLSYDRYQAVCDINGKEARSTFKLNMWRWHQVVCTYDGSMLNIYVNGEKATNSVATDYVKSEDDLVVGKGFKGDIDRVEVLGTVYSYSKVVSDYNSYKDSVGGKPAKFDLAKFLRTEKKATMYDPDNQEASYKTENAGIVTNFFSKMKYMFSSPSMFFQGVLHLIGLAVVLYGIGWFFGKAQDAGWRPGKVSKAKARYGWEVDKTDGSVKGIKKM